MDIFAKEGISAPKDIFQAEGIKPPSIGERNSLALAPRAPDEEQAKEVDSHRQQYELLAKTIYSDDEIEGIKKKGAIGFAEAQDFVSAQDVLPGGGLYQAADTAALLNTMKKKQKGEPTSSGEDELMRNYIKKNVEMNLRGMSVGGGISYYGAKMPAFMIEFAATGGVGKMAQEGAKIAVGKALEKGVVNAAPSLVQRGAGLAANVAARSAAMPTMYAPGYAERRLNDFAAVTDKGDILLKESKESPAMSALKAFGYTGAEVASEMSGAALGKYIVDPVKGILKTPLIQGVNKLPAVVRDNLYKAYKVINPNATVSKAFSAMGWNGMIEELGEERVSDVLKASLDMATDKDYTFDDYLNAITPDKDQLLVEAGIISIAGGAHAAGDVAANILQKRGLTPEVSRETVANMSAQERETFVNQNLKTVHEGSDTIQKQKPIEILADAVGTAGIQASQQIAAAKAEPPPIDNEESGFNKFYREWVDRLKPIQALTEEAVQKGADKGKGTDPYTTARLYSGVVGMIRQNLVTGTTRLNEKTGLLEVSGKSIKAIQDDFDASVAHLEPSRDVRAQDFEDYLIARRNLEDLSKMKDVKVSEATLAESNAAMARLTAKYGKDMNWFDTFAQETYEFQQRILHNLVDAGVMSQENYDSLLKKHKNYIPFQRVLDEGAFEKAISTNGLFTNANVKKVIKKIHGSDKEVKNTTQSIIANTAKIIELAQRNRVALGIADLAEYAPEQVQKTPPIMVQRGTAEFKHSYDAGLRRKLESAIEVFNNTIDRSKAKRVKGHGYVRGFYSPSEKLVHVRLGSTEGTLAHEVGHMLDFEIGLMEKMLADPKVKAELQELGDQRLSGQTVMTDKGEKIIFEDRVVDMSPEKYKEYVREDREIIANMYDAYVNAPDLLKKIAPNAKKAFDKILDENPKFEFLRQIKPSVERAEETIEKDVWSPADFAPKDTITVFRDGKKEYYTVSKPLLEAVDNMSPAQVAGSLQLLKEAFFFLPARTLRAGATLVPEFWMRNVVRDQMTAAIQSSARPSPVNFVRGLMAVIGKNGLYQEWERHGGSFNSYMELDDKGLQNAYKELFQPSGKVSRYMKNPIKLLADVSMGLEQATRIGTYEKLRGMGLSGLEAALQSREATLDFAKAGKSSKTVNQYVPFFSVGVNGVDKMIRTFKENPKATALWGVGTITVPSLIITGYYLYGAPEDERKEYLEIPQWQKDLFWIFKENGHWRRIPKPFSFGYLFGSVPERFMIWAYKGDKPEMKTFWQDFTMGIAGTLSPVYDPSSLLPPLVKVAIEDVTNYNFFTGRSITPEWMDRYEASERKNKYNSETAKAVGSALNVSPGVVDNTVRGVLAGAGTYATDAVDQIIKGIKKFNGEPLPARPTTQADTPIIKAFTVREPTGNNTNSVANFYDDWQKVNEKFATWKSKDGEEAAAYREKNAKWIAGHAAMKSYYEKMSKLNKMSDDVWQDADMSADEKVKTLSDYGDQILDTAIDANSWYKENMR